MTVVGGHEAQPLRLAAFDVASFPSGLRVTPQVEYLRCYLTDLGAQSITFADACTCSRVLPLFDNTLLTNAPGEPNVGHQLRAEIHSADRIDVVMAFIRNSGIRPLLAALRAHCQAERPLRVLTTTYRAPCLRRLRRRWRSGGVTRQNELAPTQARHKIN